MCPTLLCTFHQKADGLAAVTHSGWPWLVDSDVSPVNCVSVERQVQSWVNYSMVGFRHFE